MARGGRHHVIAGPRVKVSFWVSARDWQFLRATHPHDASAAVRRLIANYRHQVEDAGRHETEDWAALDLEGL